MTSVRDAAYELLRAHDMTIMFGNPGSTELPFLAGIPDDFQYVLGLNEGVAVAMADGYAQATGQATLVNLHTAAGVASAMGALVNAAAARVPLVITAGQQARRLLTMEALLTNADPVTLPRPLVKWAFEPPRPQDVPAALGRAIAVANQTPRGPVLLSLPLDDWTAEVEEPSLHVGHRMVTGRQAPLPSAVRVVADRLAAARNPVLLVGSGVDVEGGWEAAVALAERCALPVYWAPLEHRCGFPTTHPAYQGTLPASPTGVRKMLQGHDVVLMVGAAAFRYYLDDPGPVLPVDAELVMITSDPDQAARAPVGDAVVGDVEIALRWLVAGVPATFRPAPPAGPTPPMGLTPWPGGAVGPMPAEAIYATLARELPADAVLVTETPSTMRTCQDHVRFARPASFYSPAGASLGFGLPAAIGVRLGQPERPVVAVVGDGALQYTAPALWTAAHYQVPVTVIVLANGEYGVLKELGGRFGLSNLPGLELPGLDNLALARAYGVAARRATTPAELADALRHADSGGRPTLIEVPMAGQSPPLW